MPNSETSLLPSIHILNRFYAVFTVYCLLLLCIGVPFVFVRKMGSALILLISLAAVLAAWHICRRGKPKQSLLYFSAGIWLVMVAIIFAGLPPNGGAVVLAFALMLSIVVSRRAGVVFVVAYLLAWLVYIVLLANGLAPTPYFVNFPLTGWIIVAGAAWLILIPVPHMVRALNQGAALQRSVFEATSDALMVVDLAGKVESYNQKFIGMWGIPNNLEQARRDAGMLEYVLAQLQEPEAFLQRVREIYASEDLTSEDLVFFKDGRVIERYSHPNSMGKQIVGRVWSFRDVTESHRAQYALRSSQAKFQGLFDLSPLGMTRNDMSGKFYEMNAAFCRMLGYTKDELNAMSYWQITPESYAEQEQEQLHCLRTKGTYGPYEKEYIHKSGHHFAVRLNGMLIQSEGEEPFIWSIIEDISAQKAHEHSLMLAKKSAEEASLAKSEFLANMSHEIRTPMNAILGMLQLLGNTQLSINQFDYLNKTEGAAKSLLGLLNDILDLSKIDAGKMELDVHPFHVDRFLRELAVVLSASIGNKPIEVLYDIDPAIPTQLVGDALRLQQIFINFGSNAIKFTASGQVVISLKMAALADHLRDGLAHIECAVQDSGIGIAPENLDRIFSDFSQAESSTTRRFGGTGLGLAITKRLIEMMGGSIAVRSTLGQGSTFRFALALPALPEASAHSAAVLPVARQVLIVDDNTLSCQYMADMLRARGWTVDVAHSGSQALEQMRVHAQAQLPPYHCIYVDWQMPDMDGWETLRQLHAAHPTLPRIVMLSANGRQNLSQRTQEEQQLLSAVLVKPFTASMLVEAAERTAADADSVRQAPRSSRRQLAGMRILVVEDNAINQQVAEELLSYEGALVSIAADGRQGVHAVASAKQQFDAVLMDIQMPVMDGYAATRAIREQLLLTTLPIIGLTANAMASDREACLRAGMDEHVGKPFDMAQLVSLLIKLTGRQPLAGQHANNIAPPAMESPALQTLPDIDMAAALHRLGGMRALYVNAASQFQDALATLVADLLRLLRSGQLAPLKMSLHTLKGNTATLGLDRLSQALREVEQFCKTSVDVAHIETRVLALTPLAQSAQLALQQAISQLDEPGSRAALATPAAAMAPPTFNTSEARARLQSVLVPLLVASDLGALQAFELMRGALAALPQDDVDSIAQALKNLDLPVALQTCRKILATGTGG